MSDGVTRDTATVMIIDDTSLMRVNHKKALMNMGLLEDNIHLAEDGIVAITQIAGLLKQQKKLDLIICDWDMPKVSGMQVLQKLKQVPSTKDIPFLMITGHSKPEDIAMATKNGAASYIVKPFKTDVFTHKVLEVLGIKTTETVSAMPMDDLLKPPAK